MNNIDRMKLIKLGVKDLEEAVCAYEKAREENPGRDECFWNLPKFHTRAAIQRRIKQLRQDLLLLMKEYE